MVVFKKVIPVIEPKVRKLCFRPYKGHPYGCPNWNKKHGCPPKVRVWDEIFDAEKDVWIFFTRFNLKAHREKLLAIHPKWSQRQLDCCLYWQNAARKPLKLFLKEHFKFEKFFKTMCPEAMGINVTETMKQIGFELEWPPDVWTYQVAMGGFLK